MIKIEDASVRHADTQAAGLMTLTGTGVTILATDETLLSGPAAKAVPLALLAVFVAALYARLIDVLPPWLVAVGTCRSARRKTDDATEPSVQDQYEERRATAYAKGMALGVSLLALLVAAAFSAAAASGGSDLWEHGAYVVALACAVVAVVLVGRAL